MNKCGRYAALLLAGSILAGCSGSGSSSSNNGGGNGDASTLQILTPKIIYSKTASISNGYVTVINPTITTIKNLSYGIGNQIGGGTLTSIDEASAASCAVIAANSQCNIKLNVAAGAVAGSLGFSASNDGSLLAKLAKSTQAAKTAQLPIGIEQAYYNSVAGADGITLSYYHTVIAGVPYILVSGIVASDKAGSFNKIVLVDGNGNPIPNQQLISGNTSSSQGSTFTVLLPVSTSSGISQTIKVQTQQVASDGSVTVVSTATAANTLTTTSGVGITEMLPGAVYLTAANPEQVITLVNSGDTLAQLQSLVASNPNIEVVFNPTSLASGGTTTATLKLKNPKLPATSGSVTLNYNNGKEEVKTTAVTEQNVSPQPDPSPSPTPTPTSAPVPPAPTAGLTTAFSPDNNFFTTTAIGIVSRQLTLTNNGNTPENNFVLTLPAHFTIGAGSSNSCTVTQGASPATISDSLAASTGCSVTVTYLNNTATAQATDNISIAYNYNNGTAAPNPATAAVNYKVTQSTANLSLTPNPVSFTNILNNGVDVNEQTITVTNSGDLATVIFAAYYSGSDSSLFNISSDGNCGFGATPLAGGGGSCQFPAEFGTLADVGLAAGSKTASLDVIYLPYPASNLAIASTTVNGQLITAQSANISQGTATPAGFAGGDGSSNNQYQIQQSTTPLPSISYIITNSGTVPASNFYLSGTVSGYTVSGCGTSGSPVTLASGGGNCTVTFTLSSTAATGSQNLALSGITMHWVDEDSPTGQTQNMSGTQYVNVYAPASIAITTNPASGISVEPGGSFTITATLTGGYNVAAQTINAALTTGATSDTTFSNNDCALNSQNSYTCTITANVGASAAAATGNIITLSDTTATPAATPTPSTVSFDIVQPPPPIVGTIALPQTGQTPTAPLTATVGMDGYTYIGVPWAYNPSGALNPATRFSVGSGVEADCITDNLTGLMWVKDLNTVVIDDSSAGSSTTWANALSSIATANSGNGYCGHNDWYLPTVNDLTSLLNDGYTGKQSDWLISQGFVNVQVNYYWSSTTYAGSSTVKSAFVVNMGIGNAGYDRKNRDYYYVWPVRSGQ